MNNKSENIIVHTTGSFEKLKSILTSKSLRVTFSSENFYYNKRVISQAAHPMVCFSEYNPKTINNQINTYGKFAIGFSKKWARDKNIGPVLYVSENSIAAKGMTELLIARRKKSGNQKLEGKLKLAIMEVKCFMKNEIGYNSYTKDKNFDFKSENEWRYVPQKSKINNFLISQNQSTYEKNKDKHNKELEKYPLSFEIGDIEVIYVSNLIEKKIITKLTGIANAKVKLSKWKIK